MYISSDGSVKDPATMNYEYLVNAFAKISREIFNSQNLAEYNKNLANIQVLYTEINNRIGDFLVERMNDEVWMRNGQ